MPIELLELVVKASITEETTKKENNNPVQEQVNQLIDKKLLTEEIVEQVLAILDHKNER